MSKIMMIVTKKVMCYLTATTVMFASLVLDTKDVSSEGITGNVYKEIIMSSIPEKELDVISKKALENGKEVAEKINEFTNEVDFNTAVNYALTAYYINDNFKELYKFVDYIDDRGLEIIKNYEEAAKERKEGEVKGYEAGKLIVTFDKNTSKEEIKAIVKAEMGECENIVELFNGQYMATVSISLGQTVKMAEKEYEKYSITDIASSNDLSSTTDYASTRLNDTYTSKQYYLDSINLPGAWEYISNNAHNKVLVGVIDTGVDMTHPDLDGVMSPLSADITGDTPVLLKNAQKQYTKPHGTNVAGVIAAEANNSYGIAGVASCYNNDVVEIVAIQASTYYESYADYRFSLENAIKAMNYCVENGVKVINYSVGGLGLNDLYEDIVKDVTDAGVILVCSAGNNSTDAAYGPADVDEAISVVSTTSSNSLSSFSNFGMKKDFCAPGSNIYTTTVGGMTYNNGTSFSTPIVAAVIAMMCSVNSELNYLDARRILAETSTDIGLGTKCRNGLVNAADAVKMAVSYIPNQKVVELAKGKNVQVSSCYSNALYPANKIVDGSSSTKWMSNATANQEFVIDLGNTYLVDEVSIIHSGNTAAALEVYVSENNYSWKKIESKYKSTLSNMIVQVGLVKAKYIKIKYLENTSFIAVSEVDVKGFVSLSEVEENIVEETTTIKEVSTTNLETTVEPKVAPLEVIAPIVSCTSDNTLAVVWGQDNERILSGCLYNVYVNGVIKLNLVPCNYYTITCVDAGTVNVKVTSVLNGIESNGVTLTANITGNKSENVTIIEETTTVEEVTTVEEITTAEEETTDKKEAVYENVATGKTAYSSSAENNDYVALKAIDGTMNTRWSSAWTDNEWITVDLESEYTISSVVVFWEVAYAKEFILQVSNNGTVWNTVATVENEYCTNNEVKINSVKAQYVRIQGVKRATTYGYSIFELQIFAEKETEEYTNISNGKDAYSSSNESNEYVANKVTDGHSSTRWSSAFSDNQWIYVDLGMSKYISFVEFVWEAAYAKSYMVYVSNDGINWTLINNITNGQGGTEKISINTNARYVKMQGVLRSTAYGYSLYEMNVYGK